MAWQSICEQVGEGVRDPKRFNEDLVDAIGVIPAQLFRRIGHCLLPPCVGPAVVTELFEMRPIVSERRIRTTQRLMGSQHAECRENWEAAKRNLDRARRRLAPEHAEAVAGSGAQILHGGGGIAQEPSGDELLPPVSKEISVEHSRSPDLDPNWNNGKDGN